ncbi:hypothetical protein TWF481_002707 [Arthrobotrys musiformis]|uniref:Uncharacterized protein n=1 Tax=Arthrobotrys musiformis TaxID=47236 RepID=A0AAV9VT51_9PEZI
MKKTLPPSRAPHSDLNHNPRSSAGQSQRLLADPVDTKPHETEAEGLETLESDTATEPEIVHESILQSFCEDLQQCIVSNQQCIESTLKESPCL